jgi:hypothetical protein
LRDTESSTGISNWGQTRTALLPIYQLCKLGQITNHLPTLYRDTRMVNQLRTWTAKTAPWLPRHRDNYSSKVHGPVTGWLRQPTLTYFIAGPLAKMNNVVFNWPRTVT